MKQLVYEYLFEKKKVDMKYVSSFLDIKVVLLISKFRELEIYEIDLDEFKKKLEILELEDLNDNVIKYLQELIEY